MNLRVKKFLLLMILLIFISILLSSCSLLRGIIPSLPNKEAKYCTANAHSSHFADGYYVQLMINDPNQTVQSVTVSGPRIDGSLSLVKGVHPFYPNQWWSIPNVSLVNNPPDLPLVYTFTIIDEIDGTYNINDSVQSYVVNFATNLLPEGIQTSGDSLVFSWTGVEIEGVKYKVELCDKNWNRIWDSPLITDTSFTYNGPVLASGDYQYFVCIFDIYGNESLAYQNFQIKAPPVYPGYAIIAAGDGRNFHEKWLINKEADYVYLVLRGLGFDDDDIFYLNNQSREGVDVGSTQANLEEAITVRAVPRIGSSAPLVLFIAGHGEIGCFSLNESEMFILNSDIENWFSKLPEKSKMLIMINTCYSGSFITDPKYNISSENRVIVTPCSADQKLYPYFNHFSGLFWKYLYLQNGYDVEEAFFRASQLHNEWGEPQLDDPSGIASNMRIYIKSGPIIDLERLRWTTLCSPGELRVYNSGGQITGSVNGDITEEIPDSIYIEESKTVIIWPAIDTYRDEVVGTDAGIYGLTVTSEDEETSVFTATDIPTSKNEVHQYTIDWEALSQGWDGVNVQIDFNGDGTPELTITTDSTFTFIPAAINIDPDTLNLNSKIKWATAYIELPEGYDVTDIDVSTVNLWYKGNNNVPAEWGDIQDDTLMVKFDGEVVQGLFTGPVDVATVAVAGELQDGTPFGGNDTIRVIKKP